jgi:molybdate transport system substrate-binding protein
MASRQYLVSFLVLGLLSCAIQDQARSDELKIFTSRAVATVLGKVGPKFEKGTGHKLNITTGLSSEFIGRINAGEPFDVVAAPPPVLDGLINGGKIIAESKTALVRSANGVAVRAGAPKPDISSLEARPNWVLSPSPKRSPLRVSSLSDRCRQRFSFTQPSAPRSAPAQSPAMPQPSCLNS